MDPMIRFGVEVKTGRPVAVPLSVFARNCWLQGQIGSGKSILQYSIARQIIEQDPTACVTFVDLGGDKFVFSGLREAASPTRTFKFLSMAPEDAWNPLDMFLQFADITHATIPLVTGFLQTCWELDYGLGFGQSFFSRANAAQLRAILSDFVANGIVHPTLEQFALALAASAGNQKLRDTTEASFIAHSLMNYGQLLPTDIPELAINVQESLECGDLVYGFLPAMTDPGATIIASILAWSFIYAAMTRYMKGLPLKRLYLFVDEFPMLSGSRQFGLLFAMARKFGITVFAATQTSQQLRGNDQDLFPVLWDNCAVKIWLTPTDELDVRNLRTLSKDVVQELGTSTTSVKKFQASSSFSEVYEPMLLRNEILDCAFTGMEGFLILNDFVRHHEPIRFRFTPDWSLQDYQRLSTTPIPTRPTPSVPPADGFVVRGQLPRDQDYDSRQAQLDVLLAKKRANEDWKTV
jgi:hypothetical protein